MTRRPQILIVCAAALLAAAGYFAFRHWSAPAAPGSQAAEGATRQGAGGRPAGPAGPTPVVAVPAEKGEIDVVMNGLGTVTPLRTVTVRARVEGQLLRVLFEEGQLVREGQLLAEIDARPFQVMLMQAEGQLKRDEALLENARLDLARYDALFKQDSIAKQQVDTQASLVRQYEGAIAVDRSQIESARLQLTYTRVTAPVSGRVGLRQIDPGNVVRASDASGLVVITQLQPVAVVFTVPQDSVGTVMKRMRSGEKIPVEAWDREQRSKLADGSLASADNQVDPATGTVKLKSQFANADGALFPNQFVNARMKLDTLRDVIVIPSAAVQRGAQGLFVYVVGPDQKVVQRPVKLGPAEAQRVAILDGVAPGERIVTDGVDRLRPGAAVEVAAQRPQITPPAPATPRRGQGKKAG